MKKLEVTLVIASIVLGCLFSACKNGNSSAEKPALAGKTYKLVSSLYYYDDYENGIKNYSEIINNRIISENVVTEDFDSTTLDSFLTITRTGTKNNYAYTVNVDHWLEYDSTNGWEDKTAEYQADWNSVNYATDREDMFNGIYKVRDQQGIFTFIDETNVHIWAENLQREFFATYELNEAGTEIRITAQGITIKYFYSKNDDTISLNLTEDTRVSGTGHVWTRIYRFEKF